MSARATYASLAFDFDAIELRWDDEDFDAGPGVYLHPVEGGSFHLADSDVAGVRMIGEALAAKFNVPLHDFL